MEKENLTQQNETLIYKPQMLSRGYNIV